MGASPMSPRGPMGGPMKSPLGGNGNNCLLYTSDAADE